MSEFEAIHFCIDLDGEYISDSDIDHIYDLISNGWEFVCQIKHEAFFRRRLEKEQ